MIGIDIVMCSILSRVTPGTRSTREERVFDGSSHRQSGVRCKYQIIAAPLSLRMAIIPAFVEIVV